MNAPTAAQIVRKRISDEMRKMSLRERLLIIATFLGIAAFLLYLIASATRAKFADQSAEIQRVESLRTEVMGSSDVGREAGTIARYLELRARIAALEAQFKEVEVKEGVRSYLENLLRTKAGVSDRYEIKDAPTKEFGSDYELAPFTVRFTAVTMQGAIDFLRELVTGPHPLILTELDLRKGRVGDKLDVTADLLSIRKVK